MKKGIKKTGHKDTAFFNQLPSGIELTRYTPSLSAGSILGRIFQVIGSCKGIAGTGISLIFLPSANAVAALSIKTNSIIINFFLCSSFQSRNTL
jgi:hypothetical protein